MSDVVICDTNAVIQLAIICPGSLKDPRFVVHSIVRQEIHILRRDQEKEERLGEIFEFVQKEVPANRTYHLPGRRQEQIFDGMIRRFESGQPADLISSGSSPNDRRFLMLAKHNNAHLLTNEKTLFNLGKALLKNQETWRVGDALEYIESIGACEKLVIQRGLDKLSDYGEFLSSDCARRIRELGYNYL